MTRTHLQVLEEPFSVVARHLQGLPTTTLGLVAGLRR
jgi:hypothetical protein